MVRHIFNFHISFTLQCVFALAFIGKPTSVFSNQGSQGAPITLDRLYEELRTEPSGLVQFQLLTMLTVAGYKDRFYNLAENASAECATIAAASSIMKKRLDIGLEVDDVEMQVTRATIPEVQNGTELEHPLELVCQKLEKSFAEKPSLKEAFEVAKKVATNTTSTGRPPYAGTIYTSRATMSMFIVSTFGVPEFAKAIASEAILMQSAAGKSYSSRHALFVKSLVDIARRPEFFHSVQTVYDKTLDEFVPQLEHYPGLWSLVLNDGKTLWFVPELTRTLYQRVAEDASLKKELETTAANLGKDSDKADIDFTQL